MPDLCTRCVEVPEAQRTRPRAWWAQSSPTVLSVVGEGYELLRVYPDGDWWTTDTVPVIAFEFDPTTGCAPRPITATGDSIDSEDYIGALVLPDGNVFKPGHEWYGNVGVSLELFLSLLPREHATAKPTGDLDRVLAARARVWGATK